MTALTKHQLGQLRHVDLLALCHEADVARTAGVSELYLARRSKESLIDLLSRPRGRTPLAAMAARRSR